MERQSLWQRSLSWGWLEEDFYKEKPIRSHHSGISCYKIRRLFTSPSPCRCRHHLSLPFLAVTHAAMHVGGAKLSLQGRRTSGAERAQSTTWGNLAGDKAHAVPIACCKPWGLLQFHVREQLTRMMHQRY